MQRILTIPRDLRISGTVEKLYQMQATTYTRIRDTATENSFRRHLHVSWEPGTGGHNLVTCSVVSEKLELDPSASHLEYIIAAISAVTHHIVFYTDTHNCVTGIANMPDIHAAWLEAKSRLWSDYRGTEIQQLTEGYDNRFQKEKALLDDMLQYNLYGLFLNQLHTHFHFSGSQTADKRLHRVFGDLSLPVTETRQIMEVAADDAPLTVQLTGDIATQQLDMKNIGIYLFETLGIPPEEEADLLLDQYKGAYQLDHQSHAPLQVNMAYRISIGNAYVKKAHYQIKPLNPDTMGKQQTTKGKKKETPPAPAGSKYVCDQAVLKCSCGSTPGQLKVNSNLFVFLQDYLKAINKDKNIVPTFGTCSAQRNSPCKPALMEWQQVAEDVHLNDDVYFLLEKSTNQCSAGGGKITITDGKQKSTVQNIKIPTADLPLATPLKVENKEVVWYVSNEVYNAVPAADRCYKADDKTHQFVEEKTGSKVLAALVPHTTNPSLATYTDAKGNQTTYKKGVGAPYDYGNKKAGDAKKKLDQDIGGGSHGHAALMLEIARHTRENNTDYYKTAGPVPPTGLQGQPEYYALNYVVTSTARYRVVLDKTDTSMLTVLTTPYRGGVSIDPFVSGDLEGCIGIRNGSGGYFQQIAGMNNKVYFQQLNDKLIDLMPELLNIYRTQKGNGKMATVAFNEDKEALFFLKADPLPEITPDKTYKPWQAALKTKQEAWQKAHTPAAKPGETPAGKQGNDLIENLKSLVGKFFILGMLYTLTACAGGNTQPPGNNQQAAAVRDSTATLQSWTSALKNADTTQLQQLLDQHFNINTVLSADTAVVYGELGALPLHINRYTSLFFVIDYSKINGGKLAKSAATPDVLAQKQLDFTRWLIRHGATVTADAVKMWLLIAAPVSFLREAAPPAVLHRLAEEDLVATALRGNNDSTVINYLLENKAGLAGVTAAIRQQYGKIYTIQPSILRLLEDHGYHLQAEAGFSALQYAVFLLDEKTVVAALKKGASPKTRATWFYIEDDLIDGGSEDNKLSALEIATRKISFYREKGLISTPQYKAAVRIYSLLEKSK